MGPVTVLQNGKLLKYQTIEDGEVVEYSKIKNTWEHGVLQSTAGELTDEDWTDLANYPQFNGDKAKYKEALKKKMP